MTAGKHSHSPATIYKPHTEKEIAMPIPQFKDIYHPFMVRLAEHKECSIKDLTDKMAIHFRLSEEEKGEILPSGKETVLRNRVGWARTYLKKAGLVDSPRRGYVGITTEGIRVVSLQRTIDIDFLETIPSFSEFLNRKTQRHKEEKPSKENMSMQGDIPQADMSENFNWNKSILDKIPEFNPEWSEDTLNKWLDTVSKLKG